MTHTAPAFRLQLQISNRADLERELDGAVDEAIRAAHKNPRSGVLVTRHDAHTFTIELSQDVPHGVIHEHDTGWMPAHASRQ